MTTDQGPGAAPARLGKVSEVRGKAAAAATLITASAFVLGSVAPLLFFLLLWPGVLLSTILGIGHVDGILLSIPVTWLAYYWMFKWLFRRI